MLNLKFFLKDLEKEFDLKFNFSSPDKDLLEICSELFDLTFSIIKDNFIIESFLVHERRNGNGTMAIEKLISILNSYSFKKIILEDVDYDIYEKFWKKFGFKRNVYLGSEKYYLDLI